MTASAKWWCSAPGTTAARGAWDDLMSSSSNSTIRSHRPTSANAHRLVALATPVDLTIEPIGPLLERAGFVTGEAAVFTLEGLTMYLTEAQVLGLLRTLRDVGGISSRLAVNFGVGFEGSESRRARATSTAGRGLLALGREPIRFTLLPDEAPAFLAETGWASEAVLVGPELAKRYLAGTDLPIEQVNAKAFAVSAHRA